MGPKRFKWWHGCIAGLLVGAALWQGHAAIDGGFAKPRVVTGLTVAQFARYVQAAETPGVRPLLENIRVHPPVDGKHVVTGKSLVPQWTGVVDKSFEFVAPIPFVVPSPQPMVAQQSGIGALARSLFGNSARPAPPPVVPPKTYADVREFLAKAAPSMPYQYMWWEEPRARAGLWIGGSTFALGVLLPIALMLLVRAGLISPPPEEPDYVEPERLSGPDPKAAPPPVDMSAADAQLAAAMASAQQHLADSPTGLEPTGGGEVPAADFKPVTLGPGEAPQAVPASTEEKSYDRGEFYPVSRGQANKPQDPAPH